ncbi:efflux RND transporter permease subunit [Candidatus Beckwithbacteria bacterium]|nr:efflux RND transporter permease subunit [Candidatus Beckwithbacteria bacterium]
MKDSTSTYLKNLQFHKKLEEMSIASYFKNPRLLILLVLAVVLLGGYSFANLARTLYPKINIPVVVVTTVLPGASPADIESLVTIPIEDKIKGLSGLKTYQSTSRDSASIVYLEFNSSMDADKVKTDVQSAIDEVTNLPSDTQAPQVVKYDYENQPVWTFALIGKGDSASLIRFSKNLENRIKALSAVDKVETTGLEEQEIQIDIRPEAITSYKLNPLSIAQSVQAALNAIPAGTVNTDQLSFSVNIDQGITSIDDFRQLRITIDNNNVALGDIAVISERSKPEQIQSFYITPEDKKAHSAVTFNVYRNDNFTINQSVEDVNTAVQEELSKYSGQFSIVSTFDQADEVNEQFNRLMHDLIFTIILIVATLFTFVGLRQALVASIAVPLSFLITFIVMKFTGLTLNTVSFLSLLLALGLLIDDTIVVISAMTMYYRTGKFTPYQTALLVWKDFLIAIITTTLTTIFAFLPLLVSTGIIGEFIKPMPIVVSSSLAASFIVAMFITMPFMAIILKPNFPPRVKTFFNIILPLGVIGTFSYFFHQSPLFLWQLLALVVFMLIAYLTRPVLLPLCQNWLKTKSSKSKINISKLNSGLISFETITEKYKHLIASIIAFKGRREKIIFIILAFCLFCYSLAGFGFLESEYFPKTDQTVVYLNLELPEGTNLESTKKEALSLMPKILKDTPEVSFISLDLGKIYTSGVNFTGTGNNKAFFTVNLTPKEDRGISSAEIANGLRKSFTNYSKGKLAIVEKASGPPSGGDVEISFYGDDLAQLDQYAQKTSEFLKTQNGIADVNISIKTGTSKITFVPDKTKMQQYGLSNSTVGFWLRIFASGYSAGDIRLNQESDETEDITIRLQSGIQTPEEISKLYIPTSLGYIPLSELGSLQLKSNPSLILREDGARTISVSASITKGYSISDVNQNLSDYVKTNFSFPDNYSWTIGGVTEDNQKSTQSIMQAMIIAIILITLTMIVQFKSFRKALIVITIIPLSIAGVLLVFSLIKIPMSFPAMIGTLALFGIVVKNSILVVDKITLNLETGMPYTEAIIDGAASRLEAIALTSIAAILGLVPITISDPLWRGVGSAIISGLSFSGIIILFFIPTVYYFIFEKDTSHK